MENFLVDKFYDWLNNRREDKRLEKEDNKLVEEALKRINENSFHLANFNSMIKWRNSYFWWHSIYISYSKVDGKYVCRVKCDTISRDSKPYRNKYIAYGIAVIDFMEAYIAQHWSYYECYSESGLFTEARKAI